MRVGFGSSRWSKPGAWSACFACNTLAAPVVEPVSLNIAVMKLRNSLPVVCAVDVTVPTSDRYAKGDAMPGMEAGFASLTVMVLLVQARTFEFAMRAVVKPVGCRPFTLRAA